MTIDGGYVDTLRRAADLKRYYSLLFYSPYAKQAEFHALGLTYRERMFMAANQVGKTLSAAHEVAFHMTGMYPEWWRGRCFAEPVRGWIGGVTAESTRDNAQRLLLGMWGVFEGGTIPKPLLVGKPVPTRGVPEAIEVFRVRHVTGGVSEATFKAYSDGRTKWQGETLDFIWMDEEPPADIYSEAKTRTNVKKGVVFVTETPLLGISEVVHMFLQPAPDSSRISITMTIDDADHYSVEERRRIIASYPSHEREARTKGIPFLGSGKIFTVPEDDIKVEQFAIPKHWARIVGLDIGWDHPTAAAFMAYDRDADVVYVYDIHKASSQTPLLHAATIKARAKDAPVAWPHDALIHDKGSGVQIAHQYKGHGLKMLSEHAQFPDNRGNGVEAGIMEILERMQTGRFKVFSHLSAWFEEFRYYHRREGKVVKDRDDLISATRYGIMMLRYARVPSDSVVEEKYREKQRRKGSWMAA